MSHRLSLNAIYDVVCAVGLLALHLRLNYIILCDYFSM